jgi:hypothetical protein
MSFMCTASTFVEVVPRVPLHLARGFIHLSRGSIQAHACGRPASWLSLRTYLSPHRVSLSLPAFSSAIIPFLQLVVIKCVVFSLSHVKLPLSACYLALDPLSSRRAAAAP